MARCFSSSFFFVFFPRWLDEASDTEWTMKLTSDYFFLREVIRGNGVGMKFVEP